MDLNNLCFGCFNDKGSQNTCPYCGYTHDYNIEAGLYLAPGTLLFGKYLVGKVLGQGGFGITYLGLDVNLNIYVAIKEFFPRGLVSRMSGENRVITYSGESKEQFTLGVKSFLKEAKTLTRFLDHSNIVTVRDHFQENNTAYMVMNFLEGETLLEYLNRAGGRLPVELAVQIVISVTDALYDVHRAGIMHRDISPDNIFIDCEGRVILIDFGAARQEVREKSKSLSVILKAGYAPEEQYRSRGKQGPWTDVYAVGATLYRCITGVTPPEAMDRLAEDTLVRPLHLGVEIGFTQEQALLKALAVRATDRYQTVEEFQAAMQQREGQAEEQHNIPAADSSIVEDDSHFEANPMRSEDLEEEVILSSAKIPVELKDSKPVGLMGSGGKLFKIALAIIGSVALLVSAFTIFGGTAEPDRTESSFTPRESHTTIPQNIIDDAKKTLVCVVVQDAGGRHLGWGSGFVLGDNEPFQYVATNWHVVDPAEYGRDRVSIFLWLPDDVFVPVFVYIIQPDTDMALLQIDPAHLLYGYDPLPLATSDTVSVGDKICALGYPEGEITEVFTGHYSDIAVAEGIISKVTTWKGKGVYQIDAAVNSGNSGGPLINKQGYIIGMNTYRMLGSDGINGSLQIDYLINVLSARGIPFKSAESYPE